MEKGFFKSRIQSLKARLVIPVVRKAARVLSQWADTDDRSAVEGTHWKNEVFEEFRTWLAQAPAEAPGVSVSPEACDLHTLLSAFTGLKQEIKLQNREQFRTLETLNSMAGSIQASMDLFRQKAAELETLEQNIRQDAELRTAGLFFDVRDAMARNLLAARAMQGKKRWFRSIQDKDLERLIKGQEMGLNRLDRVLAGMGIVPVPALGKAFDPKTMQAVDKRAVPGTGSGQVVDELCGGFRKGEHVIRFASVIVAQ